MDVDLHLRTLEHILRSVDDVHSTRLAESIAEADRIHVAGEGRSGLVVATLASHLTEIGYRSEIYGSPTASRPVKNDLFLICSSSGQTQSMIYAGEMAERVGARVALVTSALISPLSRIAHTRILLLPPYIPPEAAVSNAAFLREVRGFFEQAAFLFFGRLAQFLGAQSGRTPEELERRRPE
jgi:6-phospho-3-hexuloisomerase